MKRLIILQLLSIIFMVLGLAALLYYQKLTKLEEQEKKKSKKKTYQRKEINSRSNWLNFINVYLKSI